MIREREEMIIYSWFVICYVIINVKIMDDKFYWVVKDGYLDILWSVIKKDLNVFDEDGMILILFVVVYGNLDVMRMIVGRRYGFNF